MNLKGKIIAHETGVNNKISYIIQVADQKTDVKRVTNLRYSQIRQIHQQIEKIVSKHKLHIKLPQFPSRKVFSSTNKSQDKISQREKELGQYIAQLLSIERLHCLEIMKKYYIPDEKQSSLRTEAEICIDRYTLVEGVIVYYVRIKDLKTNKQWTFKTRYSELRNVHEALMESKIKNLPQFPKKKLFGITNENPQDIERRREELEKYFNQIFSNSDVMKSEALRYFVEESKKQAAKDKELEMIKKKSKGGI